MTSVSDGDSSLNSCSSPEPLTDTSAPSLHFKARIKHEDGGTESKEGVNGCNPNDQRSSGGGKMKTVRSGVTAASKGDKQCSVCGDRALGCNFDAISCESCKAFFRRNALKQKQTKCIFDGHCKIDLNTRRFCPHCRLKKCFAVGMNKDLILGDDEKKKRLERVKRNRNNTSSVIVEDTEIVSESIVSPSASSTCEELSYTEATSIVIVPQPVAATIESVCSPAAPIVVHPAVAVAAPPPPAFELLPETTNLLSLSKLVQLGMDSGIAAHLAAENAFKAEGRPEPVPSQPLPANSLDLTRTLTADEERLLQEVVQVYHLSFTVDLEPLVHIRQLDPSLNQLVNQSSITVLRLIKFAKRLDEFARLPQVCQIGILKGCWIHILLLRSVSLYDCHRDVWVTPRGDIPTEILKNATGFVQLHDDHVSYCKSIKSIIGDDLTIVVILLVVVLFSPEGPHAVARELVSNVQDRYLVLLKHYLESRYTYERAAVMFPELMSKLKELKEFAEIHGKCLVDINPREIEPIMLEILDLK